MKDVSNSILVIHQKCVKSNSKQSIAKNPDLIHDTTNPIPSAVPKVFDVDSADNSSPLWAADYVVEMYRYYHSVELPIPQQLHQTEVTARSRAILVDWIIEVSQTTELHRETLHLIVQIVDRFLGGKKDISLNDLQLVGLGALLIGTKYEETLHFSTKELVELCAHAYEENRILEVETEILKALDYRLTIPNACTFLARFIKISCTDMNDGIKAFTALSSYILEVTLLSNNMNQKYLPSEVAAMAVFLARKCMKNTLVGQLWSEKMWYHSGYSEAKLEQISTDFVRAKKVVEDWGLKALKNKYNATLFDDVLQLAF